MTGRVVFTSNQVSAEPHRPMKVRPAKNRPKTNMLMLAKAEVRYLNGKPLTELKRNTFNVLQPERFGGAMQRVAPMRKVATLKSVGIFSEDVKSSVNNLLRNVLLFKGISFFDVERDLKLFEVDVRQPKLEQIMERLAQLVDPHGDLYKGADPTEVEKLKKQKGFWKKTKPFIRYATNTEVAVEVGKYTGGETLMRRLKVHDIVVRKTFRDQVNVMGQMETSYSMFFDAKSCEGAKLWLDSLDWKL